MKDDRIHRLAFRLMGGAVRLLAGIVLGLKTEQDDTVEQWKKSSDSYVILCAHPSEFDAVVLLAAAFPRYTRFVAGAQQIYKPSLQARLLRLIGVIPKKQFTPDIAALKEMIATVKAGDALAMMPEGRVSIDGTPSPIDISTAKLIKKLGVNVAALIPSGTFFVKPSYNFSGLIRGRVSGKLTALFTAEEIRTLSPEEILERICGVLKYNASEELRGSGRVYGSRKNTPMEHVSNLFYLCPSCRSLYTVNDSEGTVSCSSCGMRLKAGRDMFFTRDAVSEAGNADGASGSSDPQIPDISGFDSVAGWNAIQLDWEKEFWSRPDALQSFRVRKDVMTLKRETAYNPKGQGVLSLSASGFFYEDAEESIAVPLGSVPGVSADYLNGHIVFYQGDLMRRFVFEDRRFAARFVNSLMTLKMREDGRS